MGKIANFFNAQMITLPVKQKQQMLSLDQKYESLESQVTALQAENLKLRAEVNPLKQEIELLKKQVELRGASNPNGYPCDHCGSTRLKRTGTKPNKHFGEVGIKDAIFSCLDCGEESAIQQNP